MHNRLAKGLGKDDVQKLKYEYEKSYHFRKRLLEVIEEELESVYSSMRDDENYTSDWAYKQSDLVGKTKMLKKFQNYLT